jgi:hypothetical protein
MSGDWSELQRSLILLLISQKHYHLTMNLMLIDTSFI